MVIDEKDDLLINIKLSFNKNDYLINNTKLSFDIIFKNNIDNEFKEYNNATIFGKGPTFKNVDKKELRCCINQASNIVQNVDFICMNDYHNIFKINDIAYSIVKYLLIPEYLHINQIYKRWLFYKYFILYKYNFFGKLIIYNLKTSE